MTKILKELNNSAMRYTTAGWLAIAERVLNEILVCVRDAYGSTLKL